MPEGGPPITGSPIERLSPAVPAEVVALPEADDAYLVVEDDPPTVTQVVPLRPNTRAEAPAPLDDEIVEATRRGERWAWEAAYQAYAKALTGFLVLRLRDRDDVAEALSETFLRALDRASTFRGDANSFRAWLFRIARNVSNDRLRYRQRQPWADHDVDPVDLLVGDHADGLIAQQDAAAVREALATLDPDDQEVLWLRICGRLSSADVGEIVGKRPGAVRMQQQRALTLLARRMGLQP
ncbi:MAG TPA: sigma-70 family RNA polymerase sigma factor [Acidimicrobiales bacterium]|nr:sigma-70 family RNA polymerase sigma factor [Acidimicrobiales bacterium]